jgi:hypothetical protein
MLEKISSKLEPCYLHCLTVMKWICGSRVVLILLGVVLRPESHFGDIWSFCPHVRYLPYIMHRIRFFIFFYFAFLLKGFIKSYKSYGWSKDCDRIFSDLYPSSIRSRYVLLTYYRNQGTENFEICQVTHMIEAESKPHVSSSALKHSLVPNLSCLSSFNICT